MTVNWTASTFGSGQTLIGYRVQYRLRGTSTWSQTSLTTNTTADVDFAGGTPGNYEFTVIARYNDNGAGNHLCTCLLHPYAVCPPPREVQAREWTMALLIAIYPNPAHNQVYVAAASGSEVTLMDLGGRILAVQTVDQAELAFDLSGMANGGLHDPDPKQGRSDHRTSGQTVILCFFTELSRAPHMRGLFLFITEAFCSSLPASEIVFIEFVNNASC